MIFEKKTNSATIPLTIIVVHHGYFFGSHVMHTDKELIRLITHKKCSPWFKKNKTML